MRSIQFRRNITIIASTVFTVILLYLVYTQVYMKSREEQLVQTRFRVLDQMGENMKAKVQSYMTNAENYDKSMSQALKELDALKSKLAVMSLIKEVQKKYVSPDVEKLSEKIKLKQDSINNDNKVYNQDLKVIRIINENRSNLDRSDSEVVEIINPIAVRNDSIIFNTRSMELYLPGEFLLKNIERSDVFEKSIIIGEESVIFCSFSRDLKLVINDLSGNVKSEKNLSFTGPGKSDTLFLPVNNELKAVTLHSNRCYQITLSDGDYKLFLKPVRIGTLDWFICGLVNDRDFQREKHSIAPWFIIILSLMLLLIMLSLPFVKLRVMARTEMLGTGTIIFAGFAFLLGASFLVHFLFFQAYNLSRLKDSNEKIISLATEISDTLKQEMKLINNQITAVDNLLNKYSKPVDGLYETDILNKKEWNTSQYPFFDYIFLLDKGGNQTALVTPFSAKEKLINYAYRDYYKFHNEWYWPFPETTKNKKFRMESIVSTTSGDYKAAFSRPSDSNPNIIV
ncbi:MAG: hypothetical protein MUC31_00100, partial [Bacteroidales bacterium]|nr:hypothetical protein [Bacteroidales bacterium]